jgi:hypothetical protein
MGAARTAAQPNFIIAKADKIKYIESPKTKNEKITPVESNIECRTPNSGCGAERGSVCSYYIDSK